MLAFAAYCGSKSLQASQGAHMVICSSTALIIALTCTLYMKILRSHYSLVHMLLYIPGGSIHTK